MSVNYYDKTTGRIIGISGGQRLWIGSKAAHDAEVVADKMPYNVLVGILETGLFYRDKDGVETLITAGSGDNDIQVITMPTASEDNEARVVQYIGTSTQDYTHGYFYECVSDGGDPATYSWIQLSIGGGTIQVNALPTAGTATLGKVLQYLGADTNELTHGYFYECISDSGVYKWVNIPVQDNSKNIQVTSLPTASVDELNNIYEYIGSSTATLNNGFFYKCVYDDVTSTYKWENIKVQEDSRSDTQYDIMPTADSTREGDIIQYTGDTTVDYTNGYFYKCINDNGVYKWVNIPVQDSGSDNIVEGYYNSADGKFYEEDTFTTEIIGKSETIYIDLDSNKSYRWNGTGYIVITSENEKVQYETLPTADSSWENVILQYTGATTANYVNGYFYKCVSDGQTPATYSWERLDVQPNGTGVNNIVEGYRNDIDGLFYEESTYTTAITGAANTEYINLPNNKTYRWNGTAFVRLDNETVDIATSTTVGIVKPDNITIYIDSDGTLHARVWVGTLAKYYIVKDDIPDDTVVIITDYDGVPSDTYPDDYYVNGVKIVLWSTGTDAEIASMIAAADAKKINLSNYWSVGDERIVHLSAMTAGNGLNIAQPEQDVTLVLMNKGYPGEGNEGVHFVWGQKDCLAEYGRIYHNIETGDYSEYSWGGSDIRVDLNSKYYNALPETFRNCLKQFNTMTCAFANDGSGAYIQTRQDYISLFAEKEVLGNETRICNPIEIETLSQMEYYKTASNRTKLCAAHSGATAWWLRSPRNGEHFLHFCAMYHQSSTNTDYSYYNITTIKQGIAPFGCI